MTSETTEPLEITKQVLTELWENKPDAWLSPEQVIGLALRRCEYVGFDGRVRRRYRGMTIRRALNELCIRAEQERSAGKIPLFQIYRMKSKNRIYYTEYNPDFVPKEPHPLVLYRGRPISQVKQALREEREQLERGGRGE